VICPICASPFKRSPCRECHQEVPPTDDPRWALWGALVAACIHAGTSPRILGWSVKKTDNARAWLDLQGHLDRAGHLTESGALFALEGRV
jgi:hypothetical protein